MPSLLKGLRPGAGRASGYVFESMTSYHALVENYTPSFHLSQPISSIKKGPQIAACMAVLDILGIAYDPVAVYASYGTIENNTWTPKSEMDTGRYAVQFSWVGDYNNTFHPGWYFDLNFKNKQTDEISTDSYARFVIEGVPR